MSSHLIKGCFDAPFDWSLAGKNTVNATGPLTRQCGYFLDTGIGNLTLMSGYTVGGGNTTLALGTRFLPVYDTFSRRVRGNGSFYFPHIKNPLHNTFISGTPDGTDGAFRNATPAVSECIFYWCVKTVQTAYYAGRFVENITQTYVMDTLNENPWQGYSSVNPDQPSAYMANFSLKLPSRNSPQVPASFFVDNITAVDALQVFDPISPSYVTAAKIGDIPTLRWVNNLQRTPPWMQQFPNDQNSWLPPTNITRFIDLMATALTNVIRNAPSSTNGQNMIIGTAWSWRTTVQIRWAFLALPLTLLGASLMFLVATIVRSSLDSEHVGVWKTSALAVLFNGLGEDVQGSVGPNCRMGDARNKARDLMVKLVPD